MSDGACWAGGSGAGGDGSVGYPRRPLEFGDGKSVEGSAEAEESSSPEGYTWKGPESPLMSLKNDSLCLFCFIHVHQAGVYLSHVYGA